MLRVISEPSHIRPQSVYSATNLSLAGAMVTISEKGNLQDLDVPHRADYQLDLSLITRAVFLRVRALQNGDVMTVRVHLTFAPNPVRSTPEPNLDIVRRNCVTIWR